MLTAILSLIITVLAVWYFVSDFRGKFNRDYIGTGAFYLLFPFLHAIVSGVSSAVMFGVKPDFSLIDDISGKKLLCIVLCFVFAIPELIISVIGAVRFINHNRKAGFSDAHYKLCMISAAVSIPIAAAVFVFAVILCMNMAAYLSAGLIVLILFGLLTFGIGFVIMLLAFPFIIAYFGVTAVISCLPAINILIILGMIFCILHLIAAYGGISSAISLCKSGNISKKRAVLYSVLSVFMFTNLFALSQMKSK